MWRLHENKRKANVYPTHGLGPICQAMDINRGDKMDYLTSMMSDDFTLKHRIAEKAKEDPFFEQFLGWEMRGNMDLQMIRTNKGRTIMIQHDISSPRPYSRIHMLSGTKCFAQKWPLKHIAFGHKKVDDEGMKELQERLIMTGSPARISSSAGSVKGKKKSSKGKKPKPPAWTRKGASTP